MPHMMPMMWVLIYLSTLSLLMIFISLLYFFYVPNLNLSKSKKTPEKFHKWNWLW